MLSTLLGHAIEQSGGPEPLDDVERLRKATIALRGRPSQARRRAVTARERLLDCRPELQRAIGFRDPYVDALSFPQFGFLGERPGDYRPRASPAYTPRLL